MSEDAKRDLPSSPPTLNSTSSPAHKARSTSVKDTAVTPVAASTFYSSSSKSVRIDNVGSSHTAYIPPQPSKASECTPFREPELVMDDDTPGLIPTNDPGYTDDVWQDTWNSNPTESWTWPGVNSVSHKIEINGRDEDEETNWWNEEIRAKSRRPGPGILPPALAEALHNPEHALYSVSINTPLPKTGTSSGDRLPSSSPPQPSSSSSVPASPNVPPTMEETRTAIPHPNAYYCKEHNGWVLLLWRFSTVLPQFAESYKNITPLPDHTHRKRTTSCISEEPSFGQSNKTHHFHLYAQAVDARKLNPPFMRSVWEDQHLKRKRRKLTLTGDEISTSLESIDPNAKPSILNDPIVEEGDLLDLYVCCQCSLYCLVSQVIPGVIPAKFMEELSKERYTNPMLNKTPVESVIAAWETVLTIIENRLWKGETRVLPISRPRFSNQVGWSTAVRRTFEYLEFPTKPLENEVSLHPPQTEPTTPENKFVRAKLLRAWVEISTWLTLFRKSKDPADTSSHRVSVEAAREIYQERLGAHFTQIPRGLLPSSIVGIQELEKSWDALGMTPSSYSWELLAFAYLAQCRCDPANTMVYFTHINIIVEMMINLHEEVPVDLQTFIVEERSRFRFTLSDITTAAQLLGFGENGDLRMDLDDDVDDKFIADAWRSARRRAWNIQGSSQLISELNSSLRIIAEVRGSVNLHRVFEDERGTGMSPETAYSTLEVPKDVEEQMLITVYNLRVEETPSQLERMREALSVIAEVTDSNRLREFLDTGRDPGDVVITISPDMPRGLNQLGNTCYLNSLLQYFYTIKDLRDAIAPLANLDSKSLDDSKFTDDDLKRHRVGGRLVTRREILRSKRFVSQLANLFWNLEYCEIPAVTPTIDLAKLALVTSQDEEEDHELAGTDSSNDTDATLVEDAPPRSTIDRSTQSPVQGSSGSVLGKRLRDQVQPMAVDSSASESIGKEDHPIVTSPKNIRPPTPHRQASGSKRPASQGSDVEMLDISNGLRATAKPPPLPPRKPRETDDSVMMFGRQHDVSECMDNCMFQIETALLDFQEMASAEDDKTSVVKRLFYGKKRQRLTPLTPQSDRKHQASMHEKEDLFSHLHVNVADEGYDLYDGLARYFDDTVEFEGVKKRMEVTLVDLPPLLQIQLQRVQFNRETQQAYKSQAYVKFGETIYMDRFLDSTSPEKKARSKVIQTQLNACRDRIQRLTQGKHAPFAPAHGSTKEFLSKQTAFNIPEADEKLISSLGKEQDRIIAQLEKERAAAVELKAQLEDIWKDNTDVAYELTSVFIHRGSSPSWGHYFFYSRNLPAHPDSWFKYNDSDVTMVPKEEVLADTTGSTANPYMLVFSRKDSEVVETVHRFDPTMLQDG